MEEFYPGSRKKKRDYEGGVPELPQPQEDYDLGKSNTYSVGNEVVELYPIGALARALNRQPVTVRKWQQEGIIPVAPMMLPSHDQRGQRRLYTKAHIDGLRRIAAEEGLLQPNVNGKWKAVESTQFREKAVKLFKDLT